MTSPSGPRVGLFVTCLVDLFRPSIGFAAVKLLQGAGCEVVVPPTQTCCGQPAYNSGDRRSTARLARQVVDAFADVDYVVAPSGSCAGMLRKHLPEVLAEDAAYAERARTLGPKCWELTGFLSDVLGVQPAPARSAGMKVAYHDSCSSLREMGVRAQPRALLAAVDGVELIEAAEAESCCGFGGTFCVKYPEISVSMLDRKVKALADSGADTVLAGDLGCLMNIAGRMSRLGLPCEVRHVAEVLAGMTDEPPICGDAAPVAR